MKTQKQVEVIEETLIDTVGVTAREHKSQEPKTSAFRDRIG